MKTKIATSIEQNKKLLELGLDPESADMSYTNYKFKTDDNGNLVEGSCEPIGGLTIGNAFDDFPAWSLSALLDLMPIQSDMVKTDSGYNFLCESYKESNADFYDNPLDAAYSMVVWLLEQGFIKTEK